MFWTNLSDQELTNELTEIYKAKPELYMSVISAHNLSEYMNQEKEQFDASKKEEMDTLKKQKEEFQILLFEVQKTSEEQEKRKALQDEKELSLTKEMDLKLQ